MQRLTTLSSFLSARSSATALWLALGLASGACGDDGGALDSGDEPGSTGAETTASSSTAASTTADPTGEPSTTSEPGTTGEPDPDPDTSSSATTGEPEPTVEEQLEGHWVSEVCEPMPQPDGSVLYFNRDFTLGLGTWSIEGTIFGDDACSYPLLTLELGGGFTLVGPAAGIEGAYEANFDRDAIALTPHVADFVGWFDGEGCGSEPWAIDVGQDVTENGCAFVPSAAACPVEYDLVALEGADRLFFGERPVVGDMCSPRTRPTMLGANAVARQAG